MGALPPLVLGVALAMLSTKQDDRFQYKTENLDHTRYWLTDSACYGNFVYQCVYQKPGARSVRRSGCPVLDDEHVLDIREILDFSSILHPKTDKTPFFACLAKVKWPLRA